MTNEMQLAQAAGLAVPAYEAAIPAPAQSTKPVGIKKIHRLLRGRYPLVIGLGALFGIAGGLAGFLSQKPMYQSEGRIQISPVIPNVQSGQDPVMSGFDNFLRTQVQVVMSREMAQRAMEKPEWRNLNRTFSDDAIDSFTKNIDAEIIPGTQLIRADFTDLDPKAAQAGATGLCEAYKEYYDHADPFGLQGKIDLLERKKNDLGVELQSLRSNLDSLSNKYGTDDLSGYLQAQLGQLAHLKAELQDSTVDFNQAVAANGQGQEKDKDDKTKIAPPAVAMTEAQIAQIDPTMRQYIAQRADLQMKLARLRRDLYDNHPQVISVKQDLDVLNGTIAAYIDSFNSNSRTTATGTSTITGINPQADLDAKRVKMEMLTKQAEQEDQFVHEIGQQLQHIRDLHDKISSTESDLGEATRLLQNLTSQRTLMSNQMEIISSPGPATEAFDKRKQFAILGFIGGGILPACVVLLISLLDSRFRYSDETNSDLGGVPLLGILPNLPDLLTDPEQAATAAHCVHQIRTILQITGHSSDRRVFAVTSGSPGDGKTSLTLALGLSFAASGSRTLLIDGDLVGAGLTARLNVSTEHGVLEAMAARDMMPFVRTTDIADLAILPVGEAMGSYTGTIAPAAVRRLVNEARKHFDVIVIDTGPILGSIEASPVAVAADGVILCVSRGQQRPLVDRALAHLQSIGAKLAGVVFNRAQSHDFEHSVSRMSMKPLPHSNGNGQRTNGQHIGPVAKAVASSVRPSAGLNGQDRA